jgi:colanic acid/amylovoran biosynthesis glycosyltransferase
MNAYIQSKGNNIYENLFKKGDAFFPISNFWKEKLVALGCDAAKIKTQHMGVDIEKFNYNPSVRDKKNIKILSVARLIEKKGINYAVDSVARLSKEGFKILYKIVGDGPLKESLEEKVLRSDLNGTIRFLGPLSQNEIIPEIEQTDLFLLPSVTASDGDMEGIPVVLMEAMAMGKIVVSTYHSGIPELIEHNVTGFLAPERDSLSLTMLIKQVLEMSEERLEAVKLNARKHIEQHFNTSILNDRLLEEVRLLTH